MLQDILNTGEERMDKAIAAFNRELALIRTGRANPAVLNNVEVAYYGVSTPLNQIASISVQEATQLVIKPFDKTILKDIEKAIQLADLNLVPLNDGVVIRINFPALTEQRRKEFAKDVKGLSENAKISVRNIRRDLVDQLKKLEKESEISEDELKRETDNVQKLTDKYTEEIDKLYKEKEKQIMEI